MTQNLGTAVAEATMIAAVELLRSRGTTLAQLNMSALVEALRRESKAAIVRILDDGKTLLDAGRTAWLPTLLAAECTDAARRAIDSLGHNDVSPETRPTNDDTETT